MFGRRRGCVRGLLRIGPDGAAGRARGLRSGRSRWLVRAGPDGLGHPIRSGSMTDTLSSAPDVAHVIGKTIGVKVACKTPF